MDNGILDSQGMFNNLIEDCNDAIKHVVCGQYILWCATMANIAKKLALLRDGVRKEESNKLEQIENLKNQLRKCGMQVEEVSAEQLENGGIEHRVQMVEVNEGGGC